MAPPSKRSHRPGISAPVRPLRLGFVALNDAAPLVVAQELGFFRKHGLRTELSREVGWATIRDKIIYRELDAAQALGGMVISTSLGLNCLPTPCLTALVLNTNGNCLTLSTALRERGVQDARSLQEEIIRSRGERVFVFGVVFTHSSHHLLTCDWLSGGGVDLERDVRIVVVPPPQLFRNLVAGTIDGYCAGEPWNSLAVREGIGWCPATSLDLAPGHPEKVLMVRTDFAERHPGEHFAMVAALHEACAQCDDPAFRPELAQLLARREYLNVPERVIATGLASHFSDGCGRTIRPDEFLVFHRDGANDPTPARARWLINGFVRHRLLPPDAVIGPDFAASVFRSDLFHQACPTAPAPTSHEHETALH